MTRKNDAFIMTDLHLRPEELYFAERCLKEGLKNIIKLKPRYLFILGDTFHTKSTTNTTVSKLFDDFLLEAGTIVDEIVILVGNHDWGIPYEDHALEPFKRIPKVKVVDDYYILDNKNLFLSYCRESSRFSELVDKAQEESKDIERLFAHLDINGFSLGSGWEEKTSYLNPESLASYKQVFTGHYHLAQEKTLSNGTEIVYIGSAYTTDFGESNQKKRFVHLDLDTGKWEDVPTGLTYHFTFEINAGEDFPEIPIEKVAQGIKYRVKVSGTREELALVEKPSHYPRGVKVMKVFKSSKKIRMDLSSEKNDEDILQRYTETEIERSYSSIEESGFDKEKLIEFGKRFLRK